MSLFSRSRSPFSFLYWFPSLAIWVERLLFFFSNEFIDLKLWASFFFFFACYSYCSLLLTDPLLWCSVPRLVCVTGRAADNRSDIVQVDVEQSGMGKSKETFSYLVSILQISTLLLVFAFCSICLFLHTLHLCSFFFFCSFPTGKASPCVSVKC